MEMFDFIFFVRPLSIDLMSRTTQVVLLGVAMHHLALNLVWWVVGTLTMSVRREDLGKRVSHLQLAIERSTEEGLVWVEGTVVLCVPRSRWQRVILVLTWQLGFVELILKRDRLEILLGLLATKSVHWTWSEGIVLLGCSICHLLNLTGPAFLFNRHTTFVFLTFQGRRSHDVTAECREFALLYLLLDFFLYNLPQSLCGNAVDLSWCPWFRTPAAPVTAVTDMIP